MEDAKLGTFYREGFMMYFFVVYYKELLMVVFDGCPI